MGGAYNAHPPPLMDMGRENRPWTKGLKKGSGLPGHIVWIIKVVKLWLPSALILTYILDGMDGIHTTILEVSKLSSYFGSTLKQIVFNSSTINVNFLTSSKSIICVKQRTKLLIQSYRQYFIFNSLARLFHIAQIFGERYFFYLTTHSVLKVNICSYWKVKCVVPFK